MLERLKNKTKYGFSLFEVVVTMSIVAIFIAACSNVFTQRHKKRLTSPIHGRYECYRDAAGTVYERMFNNSVPIFSRAAVDGKCKFNPPNSASYIIINAVAGGGYGGSTYGGSAGTYTNLFLSSTDHVLEIIPGRAAATAATASGENTKIYDLGQSGTDSATLIIDLKGGKSDSSQTLSFRDCTFVHKEYECGVEPVCTIEETWQNPSGNVEGAVSVTFCSAKGKDVIDPGDNVVRSVKIPFKTSLPEADKDFDDGCYPPKHYQSLNQKITSIWDTYNTSAAELAQGVITYDYSKTKCPIDSPSNLYDPNVITFFKINLSVDGNYTEFAEESQLNGYVNALQISGGIASLDSSNNRISTGDGGAKGQKGGHGSVLITW